jgi:hypothetical protein
MQLLDQLGYRNVDVRIGDGYNGWPEAAPFDSIVVTAAPTEIPKPAARSAQGRRSNGDPKRIPRLAVSSARGKAAGWHHHDETNAAGEVRTLHERSCEIATGYARGYSPSSERCPKLGRSVTRATGCFGRDGRRQGENTETSGRDTLRSYAR